MKPTTIHGCNITVRLELVTPDMAKKYLEANTRNRTVSQHKVRELSSEISDGHWVMTHQGVAFDKNGDLCDGQHRLEAIVMSGCAVEMLVFRGLEIVAQDVIDTGRRRSVGDQLSIAGYKNGRTLAAVVAHVVALTRGIAVVGAASRPRTIMSKEILEQSPEISQATNRVCGKKIIGADQSMLAAVYYFGKYVQGKDDEAELFVDVFETGVPAYTGCPALAAREKVLRFKLSGAELGREEKMSLLISAWNKFAEHQPVKRMTIPKERPTLVVVN